MLGYETEKRKMRHLHQCVKETDHLQTVSSVPRLIINCQDGKKYLAHRQVYIQAHHQLHATSRCENERLGRLHPYIQETNHPQSVRSRCATQRCELGRRKETCGAPTGTQARNHQHRVPSRCEHEHLRRLHSYTKATNHPQSVRSRPSAQRYKL